MVDKSDVKKAEQKARAAEADAKRAEAESKSRAAEAEARTKAVEAATRLAEINAKIEADKNAANERAANAAATERAAENRRADEAKKRDAEAKNAAAAVPFQIGATVVAMPAGVYIGHKMAASIEKRHVAAMTAANKELASLAGEGRRVISQIDKAGGRAGKVSQAKLSGIVTAAEKLGLGKTKGPIGFAPVAMILAEAAMVRFGLAPQIKDERAKAVVNSTVSLSLFAATNLVGDRLVQNATLKALPAAKDIATIETAKKLLGKDGAKVVAEAASVASKVAPVIGKVVAKALPVAAVAMALYEGAKGFQKEGAVGAAVGVADSLTFGLVSAGRAYLNSEAEKKAEAAPSTMVTQPAPDASGGGSVTVPGYVRSDGTKVEGYTYQKGQ